MTPLAFLDIGFGEMVVVAFVALLVYGGRLPDTMRKFGATYREFRRGLENVARNPLSSSAPPPPSIPYRPASPPAGPAGGASDGPLPGASVPLTPPAPAPTSEPERVVTFPPTRPTPQPMDDPPLV